MKILDLSVATMIGLASLGSMVAWNPNQLSAQGQLYSDQSSLKEYLASVTSRLGLPWLHTSSREEVCSALDSFSNSSIEVSAEWRGYRCSTGPPTDAASAYIILEFPEGNVTLTAWRPGRQ
jgi:hypothetical protein